LACQLLTSEIAPELLDGPAGPQHIKEAIARVFGETTSLDAQMLHISNSPTLREVYAAIVASDAFRAAAGRISASYAW
jgi:hypothetical protein